MIYRPIPGFPLVCKVSPSIVSDLLLSEDHLTPEDSTEYKRLKAENNALKEEFERYKLRAQSVLKCKKVGIVI